MAKKRYTCCPVVGLLQENIFKEIVVDTKLLNSLFKWCDCKEILVLHSKMVECLFEGKTNLLSISSMNTKVTCPVLSIGVVSNW